MTPQDKTFLPPAIAPDLESLEASVRAAGDPAKLPSRSRAAHARLIGAATRLAADARDFDAACRALAKALKRDGIDP